jgi:hypothetical protein
MSASKAYKLAHETLQDNTQSQQLSETLFGQPSMIEFTALRADKKSPQKDLQVSMVVSKAGVPKKMELLNPPENISENEIRAIYKDIRKKRFRPRLVEGETTESSIVLPYSSKQSQG